MRAAVATALMLALAGCGFQPLYRGETSAAALSGVAVDPIAGGRAGWLMQAALRDRLSLEADAPPRYRLVVEIDDEITGFGIRADNAVTRERRTLRARYQLVDATSGQVLVDAAAGSDAGIDVVSSEYAVVAAEETALERLTEEVAAQIGARIALYLRSAP